MKYKQIGYALDFVSFLLEKLGDKSEKIDKIILFGSVARGTSEKESDIDLFVQTFNKEIEKQSNNIKDDFYKSVKFKKYWKLIGINNQINLSIGNLDEWGDLKRSIISDGIILYGKYYDKLENSPYYLFIISNGKNRNSNLRLWRSLYGYKQKIKNKFYLSKGIVSELNGKKLAKGLFELPLEKSQKMISFLRKEKVKFQLIPIWKEE